MALIVFKRRKYIRNTFTRFEMAEEFDNRFEYVGNDMYMWEMA